MLKNLCSNPELKKEANKQGKKKEEGKKLDPLSHFRTLPSRSSSSTLNQNNEQK